MFRLTDSKCQKSVINVIMLIIVAIFSLSFPKKNRFIQHKEQKLHRNAKIHIFLRTQIQRSNRIPNSYFMSLFSQTSTEKSDRIERKKKNVNVHTKWYNTKSPNSTTCVNHEK